MAKEGTQTPYKVYINGSTYNSPLAFFLENGSTAGGGSGDPCRVGQLNNFVITNNAGTFEIHQSWSKYAGDTIEYSIPSPVVTGIDNCSNTDDLVYLKGNQPWGYVKDMGGVDRIWTASEISAYLGVSDFGAWSLKRVAYLTDDNGDPALDPLSPVFFHRVNEESGTTVAEFQGKTALDGVITGGTFDTFMAAYGGNSGISDNSVYNFSFIEDDSTAIYKSNVSPVNNYLLESNNNSEDVVVTGLINKGMSNVLQFLDVNNSNNLASTLIPDNTFVGDWSFCIEVDLTFFQTFAPFWAFLNPAGTIGISIGLSGSNLRFVHTVGGTVHVHVAPITFSYVPTVLTIRVASGIAYFDSNGSTSSLTLAGVIDAPVDASSRFMKVDSANRIEGCLKRIMLTADDIGTAGVTAFKQGLKPTTTAEIFSTRLKDGSGTNIADESGNGYDHTLNGTGSTWEGLESQLTGVFVDAPVKTIDSSFMKSMWIKYNDVTFRTGNRVFYNSVNGSGIGCLIGTNPTGNVVFYMYNGVNFWVETSTSPIADTDPHLISCEYGGTDSTTMKMYIDGVLTGSTGISGTVSTWTESDAPELLTEVTINSTTFYPPDLEYIDCLMELNDTITATEHLTLYNKGFGLKYSERE
jgi:hypothetical protein